MLTIFNRRNLITVWSVEDLFRIKNALYDGNISCYSAMVVQGGSCRARRRGKYAEQYRVYVHKNDYDRAVAAIQPALRNR